MLTGRRRPGATIRRAAPGDLSALVTLCAAHAEYERADPPAADLRRRLHDALFAPDPALWCLMAHADRGPVGYATCTLEFSTWQGARYLHLDCLFVTEAHRGTGLGRALLTAAAQLGTALGVDQMQWQTPAWNCEAIGFYHRMGARSLPKERFWLDVGDRASALTTRTTDL